MTSPNITNHSTLDPASLIFSSLITSDLNRSALMISDLTLQTSDQSRCISPEFYRHLAPLPPHLSGGWYGAGFSRSMTVKGESQEGTISTTSVSWMVHVSTRSSSSGTVAGHQGPPRSSAPWTDEPRYAVPRAKLMGGITASKQLLLLNQLIYIQNPLSAQYYSVLCE